MPKNLDKYKQMRDDLLTNAMQLIQSGKMDEAKAALSQWAEMTNTGIQEMARSIEDMSDRQVLASRGIRQLTAEEKSYYTELCEAARQPDYQQAITNIEKAFPTTIIDAVMQDIEDSHPLLAAVTFMNTTVLTKWVYNTQERQAALWGPITSNITKELGGAIDTIDLTMCKLTAFMGVSLDLIDLGPEWVDRYVRAILADALAVGLEDGVVNGDGKDMPIGMTRSVADDVSVVSGKYPQKTAIEITDFEPETLGPIIAKMAKTPSGKTRAVGNLILVVDPAAYYSKVMPATTIRDLSGGYHTNVFPVPIDIIQSACQINEAKEEEPGYGKIYAVLGMADRYFMGVGSGGRNGRLESSDEFKFLDDVRTYKIKLQGNGRPMDDNSFVLLDITDLKPAMPKVQTVEAE